MTSSSTTSLFNINDLPEDVLSYTDDKFYNFVKELLGTSIADLLKIQSINNVPSFLLCDNAGDVIEFGDNSEEINALREKVSFAFRDGTYHVKIGIKNNLKYLNKLLSSKLEEENKKKRNLQKIINKTSLSSSILEEEINPTSQPSGTTINSTSSSSSTTETSPSSPSLTTETNPIPQQLSTTIISTLPKPIKVTQLRSPPLLTKDDHVKFVLNLMKKWTENNKDLQFDHIELIPNIDYTINITLNNNVVEGVVNCQCGVRIKLRKRNDKLQITNFYKHLRTPSCSMMREKKRQYNEQNQLPNDNNSNDMNNNMIHNRRTTTSQQPLSTITTNTSTSQRHREDTSSFSTTTSAKRNSSNLQAASSQQSSAKRHKR